MPAPNWIEKEAAVNHHQSFRFGCARTCQDMPEQTCGAPGRGNLIVQGDNLVAFKVLPSYNTGNKGWI